VLPFADASFDVVSCRAAFHHFPRLERILGEICRVARPAASIVIADLLGSEDSAKAAHHDHMERLCDPTHVRAIPEDRVPPAVRGRRSRGALRREISARHH